MDNNLHNLAHPPLMSQWRFGMKKTCIAAVLPLLLAGCYDPAANCEDDSHAKIGAYVASQNMVTQRLRSPSTADFPNFGTNGVIVNFERKCHFMVAGYVDAQNSFGGTARTRYIIEIEANPETGGYSGRNLIMN